MAYSTLSKNSVSLLILINHLNPIAMGMELKAK
jgi:hypothetical protein